MVLNVSKGVSTTQGIKIFLGLLDRRRRRHTASYPAGPESSVATLLKPQTSNDGWTGWNDIVISERLKNHTTRHRRNKQWTNVRQDYHQGTFLKRMRKTKKCLCLSTSQDLNPNTTWDCYKPHCEGEGNTV
jgi:hypothetical protein